MNIKYIRLILIFVVLIYSCTSKKDVNDPYQMTPPYKLINLFSRKIKPETSLILTSYAYNWCLPRDYQCTNGIGNFSASYRLPKSKNDEISLEYARNLIVFLAENLLQDINSNSEVRSHLDVYPFSSNLIHITIHFEDENRIDLGQGVAIVYFSKGKIEYEGYKIDKYTGRYPADGKHYTIHKETYAEALDIVKKQGTLKYL